MLFVTAAASDCVYCAVNIENRFTTSGGGGGGVLLLGTRTALASMPSPTDGDDDDDDATEDAGPPWLERMLWVRDVAMDCECRWVVKMENRLVDGG